jgi:hypothetical protein
MIVRHDSSCLFNSVYYTATQRTPFFKTRLPTVEYKSEQYKEDVSSELERNEHDQNVEIEAREEVDAGLIRRDDGQSATAIAGREKKDDEGTDKEDSILFSSYS